MYNNEPLECVKSLKYLGLEVPLNHKWNKCTTNCLDARKRPYYAFENMCNHGEIKCWALKKYIFDTLVTLVLLYGVDVWGDIIIKYTRKEFQNVLKILWYKTLNK